MKYTKCIEGVIELQITDDNKATIREIDPDAADGEQVTNSATVQLASNEEADKMIEEFEDPSGDSMYNDGAIFTKYPELHSFRP